MSTARGTPLQRLRVPERHTATAAMTAAIATRARPIAKTVMAVAS